MDNRVYAQLLELPVDPGVQPSALDDLDAGETRAVFLAFGVLMAPEVLPGMDGPDGAAITAISLRQGDLVCEDGEEEAGLRRLLVAGVEHIAERVTARLADDGATIFTMRQTIAAFDMIAAAIAHNEPRDGSDWFDRCCQMAYRCGDVASYTNAQVRDWLDRAAKLVIAGRSR